MKNFRKPYKVRRKKPMSKKLLLIVKSKLFAKILIVAIIAFCCIWLVVFSQIFQIKHIHISGAQRVLPEEIQSIVEDKIKSRILFWDTRNILFVNANKIQQGILSNFPEIIEVEITKALPDALDVAVVERNQSAVLVWLDQQFFIDNKGVVFEKDAVSSPDALKIKTCFIHSEPKLGKEVIEQSTLSSIFIIQAQLEKMKIPIEIIEIVSNSRVNVKTSEGWEIYFNTNGGTAQQARELELVLKEKISPEAREDLEYIDLRFDKIFYK